MNTLNSNFHNSQVVNVDKTPTKDEVVDGLALVLKNWDIWITGFCHDQCKEKKPIACQDCPHKGQVKKGGN